MKVFDRIISICTVICMTGITPFLSIQNIGSFQNSTIITYAADTSTYDDFTYSVLSNGSVSIDGYTGSDKKVIIPRQIDNKSVSKISFHAFKSDCKAEEIVIPNTVTCIDYGAFSCPNLSTITIPESVVEISGTPFFMNDCKSLEKIIVDERNDYYKSVDGVLYNKDITELICCPGKIASIDIPATVTSIHDRAFWYCKELSKVTIPNGVTWIKPLTFAQCDKLTTVIIPHGVTAIGENAFSSCISLTSIVIPDTVTSLGSNAFSSCKNLKNVVLSSSLQTIGAEAFAYCPSLTSITIPDSVTKLNELVFLESVNLEHIYLPSTLYEMDQYDFSSTKWWKNKVEENAVVVVNGIVLGSSDAEGEVILPDGVWKIGYQAFRYSRITNISIPESVTEISAWAFRTESLDSVTIPRSVEFIGAKAFGYYDVNYVEYKKENFKINCYKDSAGEKYAIENGFNYALIDEITNIYKCTVTLGTTSYTYDGTAKKPTVTVKNGSTTLTNGTDYTVSYSNNTNAGTATVTITGNGDYTGTATKTFTINAKSISSATVALSQSSYTYDGTEKKPTVTVKDGSITLTSGTDYTISYSNNKSVGTAKVTVTGKGNYSGTTSKNFTITEAAKTDISKCTVTLGTTSYTYDGTAKKPTVTVKNGSTTLTNGTDYTVSYSNNTNAGTATVTITGNGSYTGTATKTFTIDAKSISSATVALSQSSYTYDGTEKKPTVTVKDGSTTLINGTHYTISYTNNKNVGTATVKVTGKGNYTSSKSVNFEIKQRSAHTFTWGKDNWNFNNSSYNGYFNNSSYREQISKTYLNKLANVLTNDEYEVIFMGYWDWNGFHNAWLDDKWKGSCYGMSSTALLSKHGLLPYSQYQAGASKLYDLSCPTKNFEVSSLITYYQMLQVKDVIQQQYFSVPSHSHEENIKNLIAELDKCDTVVVGFKKKGWGGHAILAYDYSYGSWTKNGVTYDGCIYICDPNSSMQKNDDRNIYFNTKTYNWAIPYYSSHGISSAKGAVFNYIGGDVDEINTGGYLSNGQTVALSDYAARLDALEISQNHSVSKVTKDINGYTQNNAAPGEIVPDTYYVMCDENTGIFGYNLRDIDSAYEVSQDDMQELSLAIRYQNCTMNASSAAGKKAVFDNKGTVSIESENAAFGISMTFNDNYPTDWFSISVTGANTCQACMEMVENGFILTADNLEDVYVYANNKVVEADTRFSADAKRALIYEIDEKTIGIKIDKDGDGTFETPVEPNGGKPAVTCGDVNGDSSIDIMDVIRLNKFLLGIVALAPEESTAADADGNGKVESSDSLLILKYVLEMITSFAA